MINKSYRTRHDEDLNVSLSVQPWGNDGDKRRYFLVEGKDDTAFRVYRESNPQGLTQRAWRNVAGSLSELQTLAEKLEKQDGGPKARALAKRIAGSIPRFEAGEDKRRRREYRQAQRQRFRKPVENGLSLYEGRTRGKRMKYTFSDDDSEFLTDSTNRRSARNTRNQSPTEGAISAPVMTASGRQIRVPSRLNENAMGTGLSTANAPFVGEGSGSGDVEMENSTDAVEMGRGGRPKRSAAVHHGTGGWDVAGAKKQVKDDLEYDEDDEGSELDFGDDEDEHVPDDEEDEDDYEGDMDADAMDEEEDLEGDSGTALGTVQTLGSGGGMGGSGGMSSAGPRPKKARWSLVCVFPIRVMVDHDGKVRKLPTSKPSPNVHKRLRAAHRRVVLSDDDESAREASFQADGDETEEAPSSVSEKPATKPMGEVISFAARTAPLKPAVASSAGDDPGTNATSAPAAERPEGAPVEAGTPASSIFRVYNAKADALDSTKTPLTPSSNGLGTSLAFRESPEKPQHRQRNAVQPSIGVGSN